MNLRILTFKNCDLLIMESRRPIQEEHKTTCLLSHWLCRMHAVCHRNSLETLSPPGSLICKLDANLKIGWETF